MMYFTKNAKQGQNPKSQEGSSPTKAGGIRNKGQYDHIRVSGSDRSVNRLPRKPEVRSWKPEARESHFVCKINRKR